MGSSGIFGFGEQPTPEAAPSEFRHDLTLSLLEPFFDSEEELNETAAGLALTGESFDLAVIGLKKVSQDQLEDLKEQYELQKEQQELVVGETRSKRKEEEEKLKDAREKKYAREDEQLSLQRRKTVLSMRQELAWQELRQERLRQQNGYLEDESARLAREQVQDDILEDLKKGSEFAEKIYELKKKHWETNKVEYERIIKDYESEQAGIDEQIDNVQARLKKFQDAGVSRTTAGFLTRAGYVSFAGVGGVVASLLANRQTAADFLSSILDGLNSLIGLSGGGSALWGPFINLLLLVVAGAGIVVASTFITDRILGRLSRRWRQPRRGRKVANDKPEKVFAHLWNRVSSWFTNASPENGFTPKGFSPRERVEINRNSLVQLIALLPYVVASALIFFFFAALGLSPSSAKGLEISNTYIGFIFVLLSASASILYVTCVIEPRWQHYISMSKDKDGPQVIFGHYLKLHWEFVLLMGLMVLSLILAAFLPLDPPVYNRVAWGWVAIFMCLSSLGLAYGLVQKGLFKDLQYLENNRQNYRTLIDSYSVIPTIEDIFENLEAGDVGEELKEHRLTRHKWNELRRLYELNRLFADDFEDDEKLHGFLHGFARIHMPFSQFRSLFPRRKKVIEQELQTDRYVYSPQLLRTYYACKKRSELIDKRATQIREEIDKLRMIIEGTENSIEYVSQKIRRQQADLVSLATLYRKLKDQLQTRNEKDLMKFQAAFAIGRQSYELMQEPVGV